MIDENRESLEFLAEITASIVGAYVSNNAVPAADLPNVIASVYESIGRVGVTSIVTTEVVKAPTVSPKRSVTPDYLISLEDGKKYQSLKRHLSKRGLTPDEYRAKWGLPKDYPMVSQSYSKRRSELAKKLGLGRKPGLSVSRKKTGVRQRSAST